MSNRQCLEQLLATSSIVKVEWENYVGDERYDAYSTVTLFNNNVQIIRLRRDGDTQQEREDGLVNALMLMAIHGLVKTAASV